MTFQLKDLIYPAVALAIALALRYLVVEATEVGQACDVTPWEGLCAGRTALILSFRHQELGWVALGIALLATVLRYRTLGLIAVAAGLFGLILYSYEPAAVAALLGLLVIARPKGAKVHTGA
ncbi:MAG: hypothetical protein Q4D91_01325 [Lautropia sp.]|nr:hypothetical protein [Lautropia sp.]